MELKVFLADDDAGMRLMLRRIIESMDGFAIIGEAVNGADAVKQCVALKPDIVFLDVEMPELTGTEAARELSQLLPEAKVIFVTAHSEYMPEAFEVYAFDYLIKPFRTDRVRQTLRRLQKTKTAEPAPDMRTIVIRNKDAISFVTVEDVILVTREERTTRLITKDEVYITYKTISDLWPYFEGKGYMKTHRAYVVKLSEIAKIYPYGRWTWEIKLKGIEDTALITRENLEILQKQIEG